MSDKELMQEALKWQEHIKVLANEYAENELYQKRSKVLDWLIEQAELAERVHKLALDWSELVDERNRYKQALEEISNADWNSEGLDAERELDRVTDIAFKALEGTE